MSVVLENDYLKVAVKEKGAELASVENKKTNLEYMWQGDPAYWGKTSPVLFPIVGTLRDDRYVYEGNSYSLTRHGFARDSNFQVAEQKADEVIFLLTGTEASREKFPFDFRLTLKYKLVKDFLEVTYDVKNIGSDIMYFSIGGHPAFNVPLVKGSNYEDYYLLFNERENAGRWPIDPRGLIVDQPVPFLKNTSTLKLNHSLFMEDALVFKNLRSRKISIKSDVHSHGLDFYFDGFPFLGIWSAKNADFVCIEPWCGVADSVLHDQQLTTKEGIVNLSSNENWTRTWKVRFY